MSLLEYVAVMMSVVLALVIARILTFVGTLATGRSRFALSGLQLTWVALVFCNLILAWQTIWGLRGQPSYPISQVVMMLMATGLIFIAARILIPDEPADETLDLEKHFFAIRVPFFSTMALLWVFPLAGLAIFRTFDVLSADVLCRSAWHTLSIAGVLVRKPAAHRIIMVAWVGVLIVYFALIGADFSESTRSRFS